jgi:hypothetical protein
MRVGAGFGHAPGLTPAFLAVGLGLKEHWSEADWNSASQCNRTLRLNQLRCVQAVPVGSAR